MPGYVARKVAVLGFVVILFAQMLTLKSVGSVEPYTDFFLSMVALSYLYAFTPEIKSGLSDAYQWYQSRGGGS